jgi:hypothetical protein
MTTTPKDDFSDYLPVKAVPIADDDWAIVNSAGQSFAFMDDPAVAQWLVTALNQGQAKLDAQAKETVRYYIGHYQQLAREWAEDEERRSGGEVTVLYATAQAKRACYSNFVKTLRSIDKEIAALRDRAERAEAPVDAVLWCPQCFEQHIDEAAPGICETCGSDQQGCTCEVFTQWLNPPHKSHRCGNCNHVWRPAEKATNGVRSLKSKGERDGDPQPEPVATLRDRAERAEVEAKRYKELESAMHTEFKKVCKDRRQLEKAVEEKDALLDKQRDALASLTAQVAAAKGDLADTKLMYNLAFAALPESYQDSQLSLPECIEEIKTGFIEVREAFKRVNKDEPQELIEAMTGDDVLLHSVAGCIDGLFQRAEAAEGSLRVVTSQRDDTRRALGELEEAARAEGQNLRSQLSLAQTEARQAKEQATDRWLPIDSAPKDGSEVLIYSMGDMGICYWRDDDTMIGWTWGMGMRFWNPTHWQPLPAPPMPIEATAAATTEGKGEGDNEQR